MARLKSGRLSNILKGMGSVLDIFPEHHRRTEITSWLDINKTTDAEALASDWKKVGELLYSAIGKATDKQEEPHERNRDNNKPGSRVRGDRN